jgi:D-alanyl-D-alanine carboxypeptidase/D-alanyl-D-alanine-endopeptidase (penicillin-binding protein 4)
VKIAAALLAAGGLFAVAIPALAVDRAEGAGVPKPEASGAPWTDAQVAAVDANIEVTLAGERALRGAHVGLLAVDARDGRILYQRSPDERFQGASTTKLIAGSAALEKLGPDFRFRTAAVAGGPIADGTLAGALIVRAGGDPFLRNDDFDALAQALAAKGIRRVRDGVRFDVSRYDSAFYLPGWNWDDLPYGYAAPVSALAFESNAIHLTVTPASVVDTPASVTSAPLPVVQRAPVSCAFETSLRVEAAVTTVASAAGDTVDLLRTPLGCTQVVGAIPFGSAPDELDAAVPFPSVYAAQALRAALARAGISVGTSAGATQPDLSLAPAPFDAAVLWSRDSEPLSDVVADIWLPSDNLSAEMLLRELAVANGTTPGTTPAGVAFELSWLKRLGVDTGLLVLVDGSGLSAYDRVTPRALVSVLQHDWDGPLRDTVLDDLPLAGVRGTLRSQYTGTLLERRVFAKSGTMSRAGALAGYLATEHHGAVTFAFLVDEWDGDPQALAAVRARVLAHLIAD